MKKVLLVLGALLALSFIALGVSIYWWTDGSHLKPKLVKLINEQINGSVEIAKVSVKPWSNPLTLEITGFEVRDSYGRKAIGAKSAVIEVNYKTIWNRTPELVIRAKEPVFQIFREAGGRSSLATLIKPVKKGSWLESWSARIQGRDGLFSVSDAESDSHLELSGMDFKFSELALKSKHPHFSGTGQIDLKLAAKLMVHGTSDVSADWDSLGASSLGFRATLDNTDWIVPGTFQKASGVGSRAEGRLSFSTLDSANLDYLRLAVGNSSFEITGQVGIASCDLKIKSDDFSLGSVANFFTAFSSYEPEGQAGCDFALAGPLDKPELSGMLSLRGAQMQLPLFAGKPQINGSVQIGPDRLDNINLSFEGDGSQLSATGVVTGLSKIGNPGEGPQADLQLTSSSINPEKFFAGFPAWGSKLKNDAALGAMSVKIGFNGQQVAWKDQKIENLSFQASWDRHQPKLERFGFKAYGGMVTGAGNLALNDQGLLEYDLRSKIAGLDPKLLPLPKAWAWKLQPTLRLDGTVNFDTKRILSFDLSPAGSPDLKLTGSFDSKDIKLGSLKVRAKILDLKNLLIPGADIPTTKFANISADGKISPNGLRFTKLEAHDGKGVVTGSISLETRGVLPYYGYNLRFKNWALPKNEFVSGLGTGTLKGSTTRLSQLSGTGVFSIQHPKFLNINPNALAFNGLNQGLQKTAPKIVYYKGMKFPGTVLPAEYVSMNGAYRITPSVLQLKGWRAKAVSKKSVDVINADTRLAKGEIRSRILLQDTYGFTRAGEVGYRGFGLNIAHVLAPAGKPFRVPVDLACKAKFPCVDYQISSDYLASVSTINTHLAQAKLKTPTTIIAAAGPKGVVKTPIAKKKEIAPSLAPEIKVANAKEVGEKASAKAGSDKGGSNQAAGSVGDKAPSGLVQAGATKKTK